ncbi:MAG TPA: DUF1800 family protein, partial [Blastocatellia bacterium]|nr:DUF1800 family protein [Blastocatellia bacterium]
SRHPSTARFISKELCQRFVADDPPAKLVERVAQVFLKTDGEIKEVLRAIFSSPEFNSPASFRAKVKSPVELAASAIRAVDGDTDGGPPIQDWLRRMGEPLYGEQFPTGYGEKSERWVNTGVFLNRLNFLVAIANNQIRGTSYDQSRLAALADTSEPAAGRMLPAGFADPLTSRLEAAIVHTPLSAESRRAVTTSLESPTKASAGDAAPPAGKPGYTYSTTPSAVSGPRAQAQATVPPAGQPAVLPARYDANAARHHVAQIVELMLGTAEFQRR